MGVSSATVNMGAFKTPTQLSIIQDSYKLAYFSALIKFRSKKGLDLPGCSSDLCGTRQQLQINFVYPVKHKRTDRFCVKVPRQISFILNSGQILHTNNNKKRFLKGLIG